MVPKIVAATPTVVLTRAMFSQKGGEGLHTAVRIVHCLSSRKVTLDQNSAELTDATTVLQKRVWNNRKLQWYCFSLRLSFVHCMHRAHGAL